MSYDNHDLGSIGQLIVQAEWQSVAL